MKIIHLIFTALVIYSLTACSELPESSYRGSDSHTNHSSNYVSQPRIHQGGTGHLGSSNVEDKKKSASPDDTKTDRPEDSTSADELRRYFEEQARRRIEEQIREDARNAP